MSIFGENTLMNLGEVDIKPLGGYVGDSGLSRILYESELGYTQILTSIYESDFEEIALTKQGLVTEASNKFTETIRSVKNSIIEYVQKFFAKISGWYDSFIESMITAKAQMKATQGAALSLLLSEDNKINFKSYENIFDLIGNDDSLEKLIDNSLLTTKINGHVISRDHLETLSVDELKELKEYIISNGKQEIFNPDVTDTSKYIESETEKILGKEKQFTSISKKDAMDVIDAWIKSDKLIKRMKQIKNKNIKIVKQELELVNKKSEAKDETSEALIDQCLFHYLKLFNEYIVAKSSIIFKVIKQIVGTCRTILQKLTVKSIVRHESAQVLEDLVEECNVYQINKLFEGELV